MRYVRGSTSFLSQSEFSTFFGSNFPAAETDLKSRKTLIRAPEFSIGTKRLSTGVTSLMGTPLGSPLDRVPSQRRISEYGPNEDWRYRKEKFDAYISQSPAPARVLERAPGEPADVGAIAYRVGRHIWDSTTAKFGGKTFPTSQLLEVISLLGCGLRTSEQFRTLLQFRLDSSFRGHIEFAILQVILDPNEPAKINAA